MDITNNSDLILILRLEDIKGVPMRVAEIAGCKVRVYTQDPDNYIVFVKGDIDGSGDIDKLRIDTKLLQTLESGVIRYSYDYSVWDEKFQNDQKYDKVKEVVTDFYYANVSLDDTNPANPVTYKEIMDLKEMIYDEMSVRDRDDNRINIRIDELGNLIAQVDAKDSTAIYTPSGILVKEIQMIEDPDEDYSEVLVYTKKQVDAVLDEFTQGKGAELDKQLNDTLDELNAKEAQNKAAVDAKLSEVDNTITNEVNRLKTAENEHKTAVEGYISEAKSEMNAINLDYLNLKNDNADTVAGLVDGYTAKETEHQQALDSAIKEVKDEWAEKKAEVDTAIDEMEELSTYSKSEIDDKIANVSVDLSDYYTKQEVDNELMYFGFSSNGEGTDLNTINLQSKMMSVNVCFPKINGEWTNSIMENKEFNLVEQSEYDTFKGNVYTKQQVDDAIAGVDVTEQLTDYAKRAEVSAIKDASGKVIQEVVFDEPQGSDSNNVEVYTKQQCDERFARVWTGTKAQYDAISPKDNNVVYIITNE